MAEIQSVESLRQSFQLHFKYRGELAALCDILGPDEEVRAIVPGRTHGGSLNDVDALWVATDRRVVFVEEGMARSQFAELPYSDLVSVASKHGLFAGDISFKSKGRDHSLRNPHSIPNRYIDPFVSICREQIESADSADKVVHGQSPPSVMDELERLAALREKGLVTEQEFQDLKSTLIARQRH